MVRTINEKLDEVLKVNQSIVKELNNKTTELQLLQTENMRLRSILRQQDTDNVESNSNYETEEIIPSSPTHLSWNQDWHQLQRI
jgi:regulator of replication initiation timing